MIVPHRQGASSMVDAHGRSKSVLALGKKEPVYLAAKPRNGAKGKARAKV